LIVAVDTDRDQGSGDGGSPWTASELDGLGTTVAPMFKHAVTSASDWSSSLPKSSEGQPVPALAGGDCSKLFNTTNAAAAMHASPHATVVVVDSLLATVGGIECDFAFPQLHGTNIFDLEAEVAPSAIADPTGLKQSLASADCGTDPNDDSGQSEQCTETVAVDGWWYHLTFEDPAGSDDSDGPVFASLSTMLGHTLSGTVAPSSVPVRTPFRCPTTDVVGHAVTSSRVMTEVFNLDYNASRTFPGLDQIHATAFLTAGASTCTIAVGAVDEWDATVYPHSTAAYFACTHGAVGKNTPEPGLNLGFTFARDGSEVCATDGTSTIAVAEVQDDDQDPWTVAELTSLGKILTPMFAAAS
jgi:hypothetical protein